MKKILFVVLVACLLCSLFSCNQEVKSKREETYELPVISVQDEDLQTASGKAMLLKINALYDTVNLMLENGLDVPKPTKDAGSSETTMDFLDLINYMPQSKSVGDDSDFNEGLKKIEEDYNESISNLVPDYLNSVNEGLLQINEEEGVIYMSEDEIISLNSIEGIMAVEIANLISEGKSIEEAVALVNADVQHVINEIGIVEEKGLYSDRVGRFKNGVVKYMYADQGDNGLSDKAKTAIKEAMDDWSKKTGGAVKFEEVENNFWNSVAWGLTLGNVVKIKNSDLKNALGNSAVGNVAWNIVNFDENSWKDEKGNPIEFVYKMTTRHELGHTLGLQHEHQRPDRDEYIDVSNYEAEWYHYLLPVWGIIDKKQYDVNYGIFKDIEQKFVIEWDYYTVRVLWWNVKVWYISFAGYRSTNHAKTTGSFDFNSIMLYNTFPVKEKYRNSDNCRIYPIDFIVIETPFNSNKKREIHDIFTGEYDDNGWPITETRECEVGEKVTILRYYTKINTELSENDIRAVKNLY